MSDPPRLLDAGAEGLSARLLRSAERDRPSARATRRAIRVATSVASTAAAVGFGAAAAAAAEGGGALAKGVITWLLIGSLGGAVVSVSARQISLKSAERAALDSSARAPVVANTSRSRPRPPDTQTTRPRELPHGAAQSTPSSAAGEPVAARRFQALPSQSQRSQPSPSVAERNPAELSSSSPASAEARFDSARAPAPAANAPRFSEEVTAMDRARQRLSAGDASGALMLLARYQTAFPSGHFLPEALALRVEALFAEGQAADGHRAGERFLSSYPAHPLAARVRNVLARVAPMPAR
jgi:hypothetical protein